MQNDKFDAIPIPEELNHAVRDGIKEGLRQRKTLHRKRTFSRYSAVAAGILAALCAGVLLAVSYTHSDAADDLLCGDLVARAAILQTHAPFSYSERRGAI